MQGLNRVLRRVLMALMAVTMFTQCRVAESSVAMRDVSMDGWTEPVTVTYNNTDPTPLRDLNVTLHINRHFTASDIALEITTLTPDSLRYTESVTLPVQAIFVHTGYFFKPSHMMLYEMFVSAVPSLALSLQPNTERVKGKFIPFVISRALPGALTMGLCSLTDDNTNQQTDNHSE